MQIPVDFTNDREIRAAFTWLTRSGIGPRFGSRPIGWYQQSQCEALDRCRMLFAHIPQKHSALRYGWRFIGFARDFERR